MPELNLAVDDVLSLAKAAGDAAALAIWERDGKIDCGSCGGTCCQLDARLGISKAALAQGLAYPSGKEIWLQLQLPEGVRSQNADIEQAQYRAFRAVLEAEGFGKAVKKCWDYTD